jgi:hypothetical protein
LENPANHEETNASSFTSANFFGYGFEDLASADFHLDHSFELGVMPQMGNNIFSGTSSPPSQD